MIFFCLIILWSAFGSLIEYQDLNLIDFQICSNIFKTGNRKSFNSIVLHNLHLQRILKKKKIRTLAFHLFFEESHFGTNCLCASLFKDHTVKLPTEFLIFGSKIFLEVTEYLVGKISYSIHFEMFFIFLLSKFFLETITQKKLKF